jgi:hypothetical protein
MVEVLVRIDEIADFRTAGELQRFFNLIDAADIGVDERGAGLTLTSGGVIRV